MRTLYSIIWWIILPLALMRLWWRGRKEPDYRKHIPERLGFYPETDSAKKRIWVHAVSVGETRAAEPLIIALLGAYPEHTILLTHMTPTGRATGRSLFGDNLRITQAYLPYDTGFMMCRLIHHFQPCICILIETEIWPNLIVQCAKNKVPLALVNARLSQRSLEKGLRFPSLMAPLAEKFSCVAAQTETDATRLRQFGTHNVQVVGSIKFDVTPPEQAVMNGIQLRSKIGARPVLMCASTRDGEESLILDALTQLKLGNELLIIVPRHPQRFDEVAQLITSRGIPMVRRSTLHNNDNTLIPSDIRLLLGDSMGEMFMYYAASDLAFVGGSLLPLGGQNLIEACALAKPVLVGPYTFNFEAITEDAITCGAALRIQNAAELMKESVDLLHDKTSCATMSQQAQQFALRQRGATERTMAMLKPLLNPSENLKSI